jgi:hypothetical protein
MAHFGYFNNESRVIWSEEQLQMLLGLPDLNWPVDLFKCNIIDSEIREENVARQRKS